MKQIVILLLSLCLLGGSMFSAACADSTEGAVRLLCLNIGKADCMLLFSGEDVFLIDAGYTQNWPALETALKQYGVSRLRGVFLTHCHEDHEGGMLPLAHSKIAVDAWYASPLYNPTGSTHPLVRAAQLCGQEVTWLTSGQTVPAGGDASFTVLGPLKDDPENENNNSLVMRFTSSQGSILLCGDMKKEEADDLLEAGLIQPCDLLKVGHHGDSGAVSKPFVKKAQPKAAVILTATAEEPDTPAKSTLKRLDGAGCKTYVSQDFHDAVLFTLSGGNVAAEDVLWDGVPLRSEALEMSMAPADDTVTIRNVSGEAVTLSGYILFSSKGDEMLELPEITLQAGEDYTVGSLITRGAADLIWREPRIWAAKKRDTAILYDAYGRPVARADNGLEE